MASLDEKKVDYGNTLNSIIIEAQETGNLSQDSYNNLVGLVKNWEEKKQADNGLEAIYLASRILSIGWPKCEGKSDPTSSQCQDLADNIRTAIERAGRNTDSEDKAFSQFEQSINYGAGPGLG